MNAGMKDMANVMSKFLVMGMSWSDVVAASTLVPAQTIQREDLGHLSVGAVAELTIRAGRVLWDLNGLTAEPAE